MPRIGKFQAIEPGEYVGEIITLSVQATDVRISRKQRPGTTEQAHRVTIGDAEVGMAISTPLDAGVLLNLLIDDPSFVEPIRAILVEGSEPGTYDLLWNR